ncbi:carnitine monooxygenase reductase subunit YeaX [Escherichia coli]|uniref:carnitine monooxygenase reductase subunit YeaX n=1 Tax=Escherichia coli TaxID=562 RepID=UPI0007C13417|nr:carnitine monooxygenase reductase subunit YeaX [Escherichia coli]EFO1575088.1 oxidoreductase [Escherichia coli]EIY8185921.1 carnitine monooxygenase subunit YeaX [Escherichia coli]KZO79761.1 dioxygenase [Escherichia coli]MBF8899838.1 carnitine monooxygenase subunit YeaX [Escherichia coli]MBX8893978.1 carnitine monooxygenase subunit YeaX [Escherichia coli]
MSDYQMFEVQVSQVEPLTEQVKRFTLVATDGKPLPAFTGGSHVIVQMSDGDNQYSNAYSLLSSPHDTSCYQIAVRLEENSRGGSRFLHQQVKVGNRLTISTPNNLFALISSARKHLFIAGGIGITPFLSHMAELQHSDVDWQLHYCSRNPESCAFRDELVQHPQAEKVHLHHSSTGTRLELARLLADIEPGTHVYTCGPEALNEAVRSEAARLDIAADTLHFEQFAIEDKTGDAFTLVLARSGKEFVVPEEMTILQVIENNKAAKVECLCREGVCGTCETAILEGEAGHRDQYFSDEERASQQSMLICCSRAKGKRLVLDL